MGNKPKKSDAWDVLFNALGGSKTAIEDQEAEGQRSFTSSSTLPTDFTGKEILEAEGVVFLGVVEDDPIFQYVELPPGWKLVPTDHSMWSDLVDSRGKKRGAIFYKAAFYDRRAHGYVTE